jgi:hypothetical protein
MFHDGNGSKLAVAAEALRKAIYHPCVEWEWWAGIYGYVENVSRRPIHNHRRADMTHMFMRRDFVRELASTHGGL